MSATAIQQDQVRVEDPHQDGARVRQAAASLDDPLLECLVILTKQAHKPYSADALRAGLPLVDNRLTPELFERAAARAGFRSKIVKRALRRIPPVVLPAVLVLKHGQACVLEDLDLQANQARIIQPGVGGYAHIEIALDELAVLYTGYAIFLHQEYRFDRCTPQLTATHEGHWFWGTLWRFRGLYRDVLVASFFINLFVTAYPLFAMNVYDRVVPNDAVETLWVMAAGVAFVLVVDFVLKTLRGHLLEVAGKKSDVILSAMIFERIMGLKMAAMPESVGAFSSNLREFEGIRNFMTSATISVFIDLPFVALFLSLIALVGGPLVFVPLAAAVVIVGYGFAVHFPLRRVVESTFWASAQKNATLVESLNGAETLKTLSAEGLAQRKWEQSVGFLARQGVKGRMLSNSIMNVSALVQQLSMVGTVVLGVYLISAHELSMGALIASVMLASRTLQPMAQVANMTANFQQTKTALKALDGIMRLPVERPRAHRFISRPRFDGDIEFKDVSFAYPSQATQALEHVSFRIQAGEHVAIIGRIGSGKTTVEKLILGLYRPTSGSVWIDGLDVSQIDPADLRRNIGHVSQDIMLFHGTVRDNIALKAPYVDDDEIIRAATLAGVDSFTNRHPAGLAMPVKERGEGLSGGQRQSIAVARAMVLDPPILLLDEPTASMDNHTEAEMLARLQAEMVGKTLVLITHRASLLAMVNRIIVMDGGQIVADGPKQAVMEALRQGTLQVAGRR